MIHKGETWNESQVYQDRRTLRTIRRMTRFGLYNQQCNYHTGNGFTEDGQFLFIISAREGQCMVLRCHTSTGDLTCLTEPIDGIGSYWEHHKLNGACLGNGQGMDGCTSTIAPQSGWILYCRGRSLRAVNIHNLEERVLIDDYGAEWVHGVISVDPEEKDVLLPLMPAHPELVAGRRMTMDYMPAVTRHGVRLRIVRVPLAGGPASIAYEEEGISGAHCPHCPTDGDLLLLDRDLPPNFWGGSDGKTTRVWLLRLSTKELVPVNPLDRQSFQMHAGWTYSGQHVIYHGNRSREGGQSPGWYIGLADRTGKVIREYSFGTPWYGHVSAMAGRPAIILDGNVTEDQLVWLYYDRDLPRLETICTHGTDWVGLLSQYPHPHPQCDPTGRYVAYTVAGRGRSDVHVVEV